MKINRVIFIGLLAILNFSMALAADFETATSAVANMKVGWNLGNTLDANSGSLDNMWIEAWTQRRTSDYETAWGQPVTTRGLLKMMKRAGFNAIRVPVTWWPHMEATFNSVSWNNQTNALNPWDPEADPIGTQIDKEWMDRVQEVVDYVIDEGMYCILNVHHDTGTYSTSWIKASMANYNKNKDTFAAIWKQIANRFKDYDDKLIFEGYNEVLDPYDSWCYSTLGRPNGYNSNDAADAYNAINSYAQLFVNTVRATGGNNAQRNLALCTYAAAPGAGTWNSHLQDPLKEMKKPTDTTDGHIMFEVHSYLQTDNLNNCKYTVDQMLRDINTYLAPKGPVIFGEWGTSEDGVDYWNDYRENTLEYAKYFVRRAKEYGFCTLYWMGLSDGNDRSVPQFTKPDLVDFITKGFYGENFNYNATLRGDINLDGYVSLIDISLLVDHILDKGKVDISLGDLNGDGIISLVDISILVDIILNGNDEMPTEPTSAPDKPTVNASNIVMSVFSDTYGFLNDYIRYPGGWYKCEVTETMIGGATVTKAEYAEDANDTWTGQAGFWQTAGKSAAGAKKVYLTAFTPDATQLTIEILNNDNNKVADIVMPLTKGKWNYLSASVEGLDLSSLGNVSVRAGHSTIWFTDLFFAK